VTHYDQGVAYVRTWASMAGEMASGDETRPGDAMNFRRPSTDF
jgi:hypothetical protein